MKLDRLLVFSALPGFFVACAGQSTSTSAEEESPEIFAIARYVLPTNRFWDLSDHVGSDVPGGIKYDNEFRHPHQPIGGLMIDCDLTHRIGVTLAVVNPAGKKSEISSGELRGDTWAKKLKVKYHWSHSTSEHLDFSYYVVPTSGWSGPDNILSDGMTLTKKNRIDGVWKVAVTHNDDTIYQTDFQLVGCSSDSS